MSSGRGLVREVEAGPSARPSFFRRHRRKLPALLFWLVLLGGYQAYAWRSGLSPVEVAQGVIGFMSAGIFGPLVYVGLFVLRPLVLFPASLHAIAVGFVFGPILGIALTILGGNASASVAYLIGRHFGRGVLDPNDPKQPNGAMQRHADSIRKEGFGAVLAVQFVYLPFDLVNYLAGFLRVGWKPFVLATLLGSLPGTVSFVLLGASFEMDFAVHSIDLDPRTLLASAAIFLGSIGLSMYLKRRESRKGDEDGPDGA